MSRLKTVVNLMVNPRYLDCTHFLLSNDDYLIGTNNANELCYIEKKYTSKERRVFIPQKNVVQMVKDLTCPD